MQTSQNGTRYMAMSGRLGPADSFPLVCFQNMANEIRSHRDHVNTKLFIHPLMILGTLLSSNRLDFNLGPVAPKIIVTT